MVMSPATGHPRLPLALIADIVSYIPHPDNSNCLGLCSELTALVRGSRFSALNLGLEVSEPCLSPTALGQSRSVYCGGASHHALREVSLRLLEVDSDAHQPFICPYLEECVFDTLILHAVTRPTAELHGILTTPTSSNPHLIVLCLQRYSTFSGCLKPLETESAWSQTDLLIRLPVGARFWPNEPGIEQHLLFSFLDQVDQWFKSVIVENSCALEEMDMDESEQWPYKNEESAEYEDQSHFGGW